jgi:hypothetical protein
MLADYLVVYSCTRVLLPSLLRNTPILEYTNFQLMGRALSELSPRPWGLGVAPAKPKLIEVKDSYNY